MHKYVYHRGKSAACKDLVMLYAKGRGLQVGFSVSKKVGNAVVRNRTKRRLRAAGAELVCGLDDILTAPVNGSGCNEKYGLLGSNKATEEKLKLFPRNCQPVVDSIQARIAKERGLHVEVMVYGDGAQGVATYIEKIGSELRDTMAMCGVHTLGEITRDCVRVL